MGDLIHPYDRHQLFRVARLIPVEQEVIAVSVGTTAREALEMLRTNNFDQLPVLAAGNIVGAFSYRSLARNLHHVETHDDPLEQFVEDFIEPVEFVRANDEISAVLQHLERDGAVLVGDEQRLQAVMTETDVVRHLWQVTKPFVLLQDIELSMRGLMATATDRATLTTLSREAKRSAEDGAGLENLTLGQLLSLLLNPEHFEQHFSRTFGRNRALVGATLRPVREVRNKVFHFREEIRVEEYDLLVEARRYLALRMAVAKAGR